MGLGHLKEARSGPGESAQWGQTGGEHQGELSSEEQVIPIEIRSVSEADVLSTSDTSGKKAEITKDIDHIKASPESKENYCLPPGKEGLLSQAKVQSNFDKESNTHTETQVPSRLSLFANVPPYIYFTPVNGGQRECILSEDSTCTTKSDKENNEVNSENSLVLAKEGNLIWQVRKHFSL